MNGAVLERLGRGDAADSFNWVTRAKIQSLMNEHYHRCKTAVDQHLDAYYGDRQGSVFMRAGITARVTVELFESQACQLIGMLVDSVNPPLRNARSFQMVTEAANGFISYLDMTMNRIGPRIDLEMRNLPKAENYSQDSGDIWAESRGRIVERLDGQRAQFGFAVKPAPALAEPLPSEPHSYFPEARAETPPVCEAEFDAPEPEFEQPLTLEEESILPEPGFDKPLTLEAESILPEPGPDMLEVLDADPLRPEPEFMPILADKAGEPAPLAPHWQDMWTDIAVQLCTGRLRPETQGDLRRAMTDWFAARDIEGAQAEVDECARRFWQKFAATQRITSRLVKSADDAAMDPGETAFGRLAWQSGSLRGGGRASDANATARIAEIRRSDTIEPVEAAPDEFATIAPAHEKPAPGEIRYHVSWSMRQDSRVTAPYFELD